MPSPWWPPTRRATCRRSSARSAGGCRALRCLVSIMPSERRSASRSRRTSGLRRTARRSRPTGSGRKRRKRAGPGRAAAERRSRRPPARPTGRSSPRAWSGEGGSPGRGAQAGVAAAARLPVGRSLEYTFRIRVRVRKSQEVRQEQNQSQNETGPEVSGPVAVSVAACQRTLRNPDSDSEVLRTRRADRQSAHRRPGEPPTFIQCQRPGSPPGSRRSSPWC